MSHYIQHLDPTRMQRIETALQQLQEYPQVLERNRHRFSESPPPYESPPITEPPSPSILLAQRSAYEKDELFRQPLNNLELWHLRTSFCGYLPGDRYHEEADEERKRIHTAYFKRDDQGNRTYSGPELKGRGGTDRCDVMIRNAIRKRWERLGVWNAAWGIPGRLKRQQNDEYLGWRWEWAEPNLFTLGPQLTGTIEDEFWPSAVQETAGERAVRCFVQERGRWNDQIKISQEGSEVDGEIDVDARERFIISRPWFQYELEIAEEKERLDRILGSKVHETATTNTEARWQHDGRWKGTWGKTPGWKWRHESPSPEPENPSNMDYSLSEIDALEAVPPPTPPPVFPAAPVGLPPGFRFGCTAEEDQHTGRILTLYEDSHVMSDDPEIDNEPAAMPGNSSHHRRNAAGIARGRQRSGKRRMDEEDSRNDSGVTPNPPKRVKCVSETESLSPDVRVKRRSQRRGNSSRWESSNTSDKALGTMWLDVSSPASMPAANKTSGKDCSKLRRSVRLANKHAAGTKDEDTHIALARTRAGARLQKSQTQKCQEATNTRDRSGRSRRSRRG